MAVSLGDVVVRFLGDTSSLQSSLGQVAKQMGGFGGFAAGVGVAVGGALIGIGVQSVQMAGDFQQSMLKVQAYAGLSTDQMKSMQSSIMSLSGQVAQSPKALADAIYPIISSGYAAKDALNILSLSAKTAAASGAQTSVVADMLTTSLGAMHAPASQASQYMDQFNKIVALGKGEVPQYAAVIGKLSLAADAAHIPFGAMGAALADLTTHGFPSVAQASTALGNLFTQMGPKVDAMKQHADKLGIAFNENAFKTMDLSQKLDYLQKVTGGNQGEILKLVGGNTLALKAFDALSGSSKTLSDNMKQMGNAAGTTNAAFATASQGFNFQMQRLGAAGQVLMVTLGNALLPTITKIVAAITPVVSSLSQWVSGLGDLSGAASSALGPFGGLISQGKMIWEIMTEVGKALYVVGLGLVSGITPFIDPIEKAFASLAAVINDLNTKELGGLVSASHNLMDLPLFQWGQQLGKTLGTFLVTAITAVTAVLKFLEPYILAVHQAVMDFAVAILVRVIPVIQNWWEQVQGFINFWKAAWPYLGPIVKGVWDEIVGVVKIAWAIVKGIVLIGLDILGGNWGQAWTDMKDMLGGVWDGIKTLISGGLQIINGLFAGLPAKALAWGVNMITGFVNGIKSMLGAVGNAVGAVGTTVKNFLGIHSPAKMGPLAEADQWGPNLARMYAGGMTSGLPAITSASTTLATPLAAGGRNASAARAQTAHIHVYLGGKEIVSQLMPMVYDEARAMTGWRPVG